MPFPGSASASTAETEYYITKATVCQEQKNTVTQNQHKKTYNLQSINGECPNHIAVCVEARHDRVALAPAGP